MQWTQCGCDWNLPGSSSVICDSFGFDIYSGIRNNGTLNNIIINQRLRKYNNKTKEFKKKIDENDLFKVTPLPFNSHAKYSAIKRFKIKMRKRGFVFMCSTTHSSNAKKCWWQTKEKMKIFNDKKSYLWRFQFVFVFLLRDVLRGAVLRHDVLLLFRRRGVVTLCVVAVVAFRVLLLVQGGHRVGGWLLQTGARRRRGYSKNKKYQQKNYISFPT